MYPIRPISDLRNKFTEIEQQVSAEGPVFLTKNGYGSMVVMSIDDFSLMTDSVELALDEADKSAVESIKRYSHKEVFGSLREALNGNAKLRA
jgi:prevent-host-death family protein